MVAEIANTSVTILRGVTVSAYGDVQDDRQPYLTSIPACLLENSQTVSDPASQTPMTIRGADCVIPLWTDAADSDQILDESTGNVYAIEDIIRAPILTGGVTDLRMSLRRVTATGP